MRLARYVAVMALTLTACGTPTPGTAIPTAPPDPKTEWTQAVTAAGFVPKPPHTYDEMYGASIVFCGEPGALGIAHDAYLTLTPPGDTNTVMPAPGRDPFLAAKAYGDATWRWSCGRQNNDNGIGDSQ